MTRVLFVRTAPGDGPPDWAGADVSVRVIKDPWETAFAVLREPTDLIVSDAILPEEVGPIDLPVLLAQSLPAEVAAARGMLWRIASVSDAGRTPLGRLAPRLADLQREAREILAAVAAQGVRPAKQGSPPLGRLAAPKQSAAEQPAEAQAAAAQEGIAAAHWYRAASEPVTIVVAPVLRLTDIEEIIDLLEDGPGLHIRFRLYRDGAYRIDGMTDDRDTLARWAAALPGVAQAQIDCERIDLRPAVQP